jgi:hypothetical protein
MAIKGAIPMRHGDVFPHGCFVVGEVQAMRDFDRSTREQAVQAVDRDSGELVWTVDVVDADPDARDRTVRVKITAPVQPVPPETAPGCRSAGRVRRPRRRRRTWRPLRRAGQADLVVQGHGMHARRRRRWAWER